MTNEFATCYGFNKNQKTNQKGVLMKKLLLTVLTASIFIPVVQAALPPAQLAEQIKKAGDKINGNLQEIKTLITTALAKSKQSAEQLSAKLTKDLTDTKISLEKASADTKTFETKLATANKNNEELSKQLADAQEAFTALIKQLTASTEALKKTVGE